MDDSEKYGYAGIPDEKTKENDSEKGIGSIISLFTMSLDVYPGGPGNLTPRFFRKFGPFFENLAAKKT